MPVGNQVVKPGPPDGSEVFHSNCAAVQVFDHITSRWGIWVLLGLHHGPLRFFELRGRIEGISEKMLSQTLRNLVRDGLVWRHVEPTVPPQVTYGLTEIGSGTADHLTGMFGWIRDHAEAIVDTQVRYDDAR
jgi:DNA-binding HxlR family transcriptional regulator